METKLGKKIVVLGVSASGKSTFARALAAKTQLPLIHMDEIMWNPNWQYVGDEETLELISKTSENEEWIIEGYIDKSARVELFNKADVLLYLDYPAWIPALRYIKRWWQHIAETPGLSYPDVQRSLVSNFSNGYTKKKKCIVLKNCLKK